VRRADIERQAIALQSSTDTPEDVLNAVLPGVCSEPRLVRTRALEVAVEAAIDTSDQADRVGAKLRDTLESGPPLTTREIELLLPLARECPRALADCLQPLFDVINGSDEYNNEESLVGGGGPDRRKVAAVTVLVVAVEKAPGLFQGAVPMLLELAEPNSAVGRRCLWALARLADVEPATVRPAIADAVWTIEDESADDRTQALDRLSTLGRICPAALPDKAVTAVESVAAQARPTTRAYAFYTLAAIGGRPSEALRHHTIDFDDTDDLFLGSRPELLDELIGEEPIPPGRDGSNVLASHRTVVLEALQAEDPKVANAAQDAAIVLGRESPSWLRSNPDKIWLLVTDDSSNNRESAASLLQRSILGAPATFLHQAFTWLQRLVGDSEDRVCHRSIAALGTLLSELLNRDDLSAGSGPNVISVWGTLLGRYLTGSREVREVIADTLEDIDFAALPSRAIEAGTDGLLTRIERIGDSEARINSDDGLDVVRESHEDWSIDQSAFSDLIRFSAWLLEQTDSPNQRLSKAIAASIEPGDSSYEDMFDTLASAESSLRHSRVSIDEALETAYWSPEEFDSEDLRVEVLDAAQALDIVDPEVLAPMVEDATSDILNEETPYWTEAAGVQTLEEILLEHPSVAEHVREDLVETVRTANDKQRGVGARLVATAFLAAPPRDRSITEELASLLEKLVSEPIVETWLAAAIVVLESDGTTRARAVERLRSLRVRGDLDTFGNALGVVCASTGSLPAALADPLLASEPEILFEALEKLTVAPLIHQPALDRLFRRGVVKSDPAARVEIVSVLESLPVESRSRLVSTIRQERVLWFLTGENLHSALRLLSSDGASDGHETIEPEVADEYQSALAAYKIHPDSEVRELAADLLEDTNQAVSPSKPRFKSAYRSQPVLGRVENDETPLVDRPNETESAGSADYTDQLIQAVRHGSPDTTLAGLEAIQCRLDRGAIDWQRAEKTVMDHLTDRWRVIRRAAARVVLRATWAGFADPDLTFLADRLSSDEAASGVLCQILVAVDPNPDEWPAPERIAPLFIDLLLSGKSHSERLAAGQGLKALAGSAPDSIREAVVDGITRLADGEGDTLTAYHLLAAFDRLVDEHGYLADEIAGYLATVLTSHSMAGVPAHDDGRTLGPVTTEAARPTNRLMVYRRVVEIAAHGGLRAYRGVLDPPDPLAIDDVLTAGNVMSFLRNSSDEAVQDIGPKLLESLPQEAFMDLLEAWLETDPTHSPALATRRVDVIPLLARASDGETAGELSDRPRFVDVVADELSATDSEVRVAAVTALSQLTTGGYCPPDELVAHLLGRTADPSGWVRRSTAEALADHASAGKLTGDWLYSWACQELDSPRSLRARTGAMLLGALGAKVPSLRRQCLEAATTVFPTGRTELDARLENTITRLLDRSPVLENSLDAGILNRLNRPVDE